MIEINNGLEFRKYIGQYEGQVYSMFRKFINRVMYGDPAKKDLTKEEVKGGRMKTFFTVLQVRFWQLMQLNLIYSLFVAPLVFIFYVYLILNIDQPDNAPSLLFALIVAVPFWVIAGPATAGFTNVISTWAKDEHAWTWADFKEGVKKHWKKALLIGLINGILLVMFDLNFAFYASVTKGSFFNQFFSYTMILVVILFGMMNLFIFPLMVNYELKLLQLYKNAFFLTMLNLPLNFCMLVLTLIIFLALFIFGELLMFIPVILLGFTIPGFVAISYSNYVMDKYVPFLKGFGKKGKGQE